MSIRQKIIFFLALSAVYAIVYQVLEKIKAKKEANKPQNTQEDTEVFSRGSTVTSQGLAMANNIATTVNLDTQFVANGNSEKFIIPVTIAVGERCHFVIMTDLSSQSDIVYTILGVEKNNELTVQVINYTGININTIPIQISILKLI